MIAPRAISPGISALAIGGAVMLAVVAMSALAILGGVGLAGAIIAFYGFPIVLLAPTPRHWRFLITSAAALAAAPAIWFAVMILSPSRVQGRKWSQETGWTPIVPPELLDVIATSAVIWSALFIVMLGSLALLKRVGLAAKDQL